ncbi:MAG: diguanylate cyclase domain-containing protein [Pseudothermotoga sp.]
MEEALSFFLDSVGIPMAIIDENFTIYMANQELCELIGVSKEKLQHTNWAEFVNLDDLEKMKHYFESRRENMPAQDRFYLTLRNYHGNKKELLLKIKMIPKTQKSLISMTDVTELKQLAEKLTRKNKCQEAILQVVAHVLRNDVQNLYQFLLKKAVQTVKGAQAGSVLVKEKDIYVYKAAVGYDLSKLSRVFFHKNELVQGETRDVMLVRDFSINEKLDKERKDPLYAAGKIDQIKVMMTIPVLIREETVGFINLDNFDDPDAFNEESIEAARLFALHMGIIFERLNLEEQIRKQAEQMRFLSYHDPLTGLANRRFLQEEAERILAFSKRQCKPVSVLYLDLSNFKKINDNFGHHTGDRVLKLVADRLRKCARKSDFVARIGGDEFVFVLSGTSVNGAIQFVKRMIRQIEAPISVEGGEFQISANVGIAEYPKDGDDFEKILRNADRAMYCAKMHRKPYCIFES